MTRATIKILLVDADPVFRLGLTTVVNNYPDLEIVAEADSVATTFNQLAKLMPDIILIDPILNTPPQSPSVWQMCRQLRTVYPNLPILIISSSLTGTEVQTAKNIAISGYVAKTTPIDTIVLAIRQVAQGYTYWNWNNITPSSNSGWLGILRQSRWLNQLQQSGLAQIDASLAEIELQLQRTSIPVDRVYWQGRKRELLAARWLVVRMASGVRQTEEIIVSEIPSPVVALSQPSTQITSTTAPQLSLNVSPEQSIVFTRTWESLNLGWANYSGQVLAIDILKSDQKQQLVYLVLIELEKTLLILKNSASPEGLTLNLSEIIQEIEINATRNFLTENNLEQFSLALENNRSESSNFQRQYLFTQLSPVLNLCLYLVWQQPLIVENVAYRIEAPEALLYSQQLLQNWVILMANQVMQIILNQLSGQELVQHTLFLAQYKTSRNIARFRNELAWQDRQEKYWEIPQNIFESRYRLLVIDGLGIRKKYIYGARIDELQQLQGIQWLVTILLEARDAIAPRLRGVISLLGNGVVYLLTQVVGRGIGLIGRGIVQGVGNSLQDGRYSQRR